MILSADYKEILSTLSDHNVKYMIVGGYAFAAYEHPRTTLDLDIFVEASPENLEDLLVNKKASGRPKDIADVAIIEHMMKQRGS